MVGPDHTQRFRIEYSVGQNGWLVRRVTKTTRGWLMASIKEPGPRLRGDFTMKSPNLTPPPSLLASRSFVSLPTLLLPLRASYAVRQFYVGMSIAINNATGPERRGELNGLSMMVSSFARALAPVACSALFAFSIDGDHPFPFDYHLVFYLLGALRLTVALMGWYRITGAASEETRSLMLDE